MISIRDAAFASAFDRSVLPEPFRPRATCPPGPETVLDPDLDSTLDQIFKSIGPSSDDDDVDVDVDDVDDGEDEVDG